MDPSQRQQIMSILKIEEYILISSCACIRRRFLWRDQQISDYEGIVSEDSAEDSAGFEVL